MTDLVENILFQKSFVIKKLVKINQLV